MAILMSSTLHLLHHYNHHIKDCPHSMYVAIKEGLHHHIESKTNFD